MRPQYACALLRDQCGNLWFEQRASGSRLAARRLTCFGGRIEGEGREGWRRALKRELREELGEGIRVTWPANPRSIDLFHRNGQWIARFALLTIECQAGARILPGRGLKKLPAAAWGKRPVSSWHRAVILAWQLGKPRAIVD